MLRPSALVTLGLALLAGIVPATAPAAAVLYDATTGTLPSNQGWTYLADPLFSAQARQRFADGAAVLDSTPATTDKAGWFSNLAPFPKHPRQPALDRRAGFILGFIVRLPAESHNRPERAGFSVIATAADLSGIELGFWTDQVWAQSGPDFLHAETASINAADGRVQYDLVIHADRYQLLAAGQPVLEGPLRRYDSFGTPYNIPEFLFLGDDTTSAGARVELTRVTVSDLPRVQITREAAQLTLTVAADAGRTIAFEASTDLAAWTGLGTAVSTNGAAALGVPLSSETPPRFFRAALR